MPEIQADGGKMILDYAKPKTIVKLVAGLGSEIFERLGEPLPPADVDFTTIKGIGPTFARRLKEADIHTYADLAALTPQQVKEITAVADWQADPQEWIKQARALT